jgi:hypothetical protein
MLIIRFNRIREEEYGNAKTYSFAGSCENDKLAQVIYLPKD